MHCMSVECTIHWLLLLLWLAWNSTRWSAHFWMQVVACPTSHRAQWCKERCNKKEEKTNTNTQNIDNRDSGHNSFRSCRKITKTLYFLLILLVFGWPQFSLLFDREYRTFMRNWFSIPSNLNRKSYISYEYYTYVQSTLWTYSNLSEKLWVLLDNKIFGHI